MALSERRHQAIQVLNRFYAKPIARISFELLISVMAILFFAMFAIRPTLLTMSDLIKEIEDKRELDQALNQKIAALSTSQAEYLQLQNRLLVLDEAIPTNPDLVDTLKILEKIASDRGLAITTMTVNDIPEKPQDNATFERLERRDLIMSMTVTGDYPTIRQLVEDLRQSRRSFVVDAVAFNTSEENGASVLKATLTINAPFFGPKVVKTTGAGTVQP